MQQVLKPQERHSALCYYRKVLDGVPGGAQSQVRPFPSHLPSARTFYGQNLRKTALLRQAEATDTRQTHKVKGCFLSILGKRHPKCGGEQ